MYLSPSAPNRAQIASEIQLEQGSAVDSQAEQLTKSRSSVRSWTSISGLPLFSLFPPDSFSIGAIVCRDPTTQSKLCLVNGMPDQKTGPEALALRLARSELSTLWLLGTTDRDQNLPSYIYIRMQVTPFRTHDQVLLCNDADLPMTENAMYVRVIANASSHAERTQIGIFHDPRGGNGLHFELLKCFRAVFS